MPLRKPANLLQCLGACLFFLTLSGLISAQAGNRGSEIFTSGGNGTKEDPYHIENVEQLQAIRHHLDKHFILIADIDASETVHWNDGAGFEPIGPQAFTGSLDGNRKVIRYLTIHQNEPVTTGFIRVLGNTGVILNLGLEEISIRGSGNVGGLTGINSGTIKRSYVTGIVEAAVISQVGGMAGRNNGMISESFAATDIVLDREVSSLVMCGGLAGVNEGTISSSYASGSINATRTGAASDIGGLAGRSEYGRVMESYATSNIVGRLVKKYGLIGLPLGISRFTDSYWSIEFFDETTETILVGQSTEEMMQQSTFQNWNFEEEGTWSISEGMSFPYHQWQDELLGHNLPAPRNLSPQALDEHIALTWQAPHAGTPAGYNVYRDNILVNTNGMLADTSFIDYQVDNFVPYRYHVTAVYHHDASVFETRSVSVLTQAISEPLEGNGTSDDPWLISEAEHLDRVRFYPSAHYRLTANIDLGRPPWTDGNGWIPIHNFSGTLDGNGFLIEGLTINRKFAYNSALFETIAAEAVVKNLGLINVQIDVSGNAASLASTNRGTVSGVFATGSIKAGSSAAGLVTVNIGSIRNSYTSSRVEGSSWVGGMVAVSRSGQITNSYSHGAVKGLDMWTTRGFVASGAGNATGCFWDVISSGDDRSAGDRGKTTEELLQRATFEEWDFGPDGWAIDDGASYPYLYWQQQAMGHNLPAPFHLTTLSGQDTIILEWEMLQTSRPPTGFLVYKNDDPVFVPAANAETGLNYTDSDVENETFYTYRVTAVYDFSDRQLESNPTGEVTATPFAGFAGGMGTEEQPYEIATAVQLHHIRADLSAHYRLIADIDVGRTPWNTGEGWDPIGENDLYGDLTYMFTGSLDGGNHIISGLTINRSQNYNGLFGVLGRGSVLKNIRLENADINGGQYTGSLVGLARNSTLVNVHASGNVVGGQYTGGLAGNLEYTSASGTAAVEVAGARYTGGFAGLSSGVVENSHATGSVTATFDVGGLLGALTSTVQNSSATGNVTGSGWSSSSSPKGTGGLIGRTTSGTLISNSYATGNVTGRTLVGGLTGYNGSSEITGSYATGNVKSDLSDAGGLAGYNNGSITNSYATGEVSGSQCIGSLVGNNGTSSFLEYTYAAGLVDGVESTGGLAGCNRSRRNMGNNHWDIQSTGQSLAYGSQTIEGSMAWGLPTAHMVQSSYFEEWDFEDTWAIHEGESYPFLQETPQDPPPAPFEIPPVPTNQDPEMDSNRPTEFALHQNYPNPFNSLTTIRFELPVDADANLTVYDLLGRRVATLVDSHLRTGIHTSTFDASHLGSGLYIYRLSAGKVVFTRKMMHVK